MIQREQFSSDERWSEISDFPGYSVSDWGRVLNDRTGFQIKVTRNTKELPIVGLMRNGTQHKRALPLLVARAYVPTIRNHKEFDTPINLNGDRTDNHYTNLTWRPLWFARKYHAQFLDNHETIIDPVEDMETGEVYKNSMHAATVNGLLDIEIYMAMTNNTYVWPTGQIFREHIER
jgi:hypothetical protein